MEPSGYSLSPLQEDALRELGSIGAAHTATALAQLIGRRMEISVPVVKIMKLEQIHELMGGEDQPVACISAQLFGGARGTILALLPRRNALALSDALLGQAPGASTEITEVSKSALLELGNMLFGAYLTAISNLLGVMLLASVPTLVIENTGALVDMMRQQAENGQRRMLVVHTYFQNTESTLSGHVLFTPEKSTIDAMLNAVHRLLGGKPADK